MRQYSSIYFWSLCIITFSCSLFSEEPQEIIVLNLETTLKRALQYNREILSSLDAKERAEMDVSVAYSAFDLAIIPSGDLGYIGGGTAGQGLAYTAGVDLIKKLACGTRISINPYYQKFNYKYHPNVNTVITQPLLRGLGKRYTHAQTAAAKFALRSSLRSFQMAQSRLILRAITSLYEIAKMEKNVLLYKESYERIKKFHQASIVKERIGMGDPLDTYRASIELTQAEDSLNSAKEQLQEKEDALRDLLAFSADTQFRVEVPIVHTPSPIKLDEAVETALKHRLEIDQAEDQVAEDRRLSKIAKNRLLPELNLVVNYSNIAPDQVFTETWVKKRQSSYGFGFTTSSDVNSPGNKAAYEQSLTEIDSAIRDVEQTKATLTFEVRRALRNLERALEKIELQQKQIKMSEGELRLAQIKFDRGMTNNFDMIQAEKSFRGSEMNCWQAVIDHMIGEYQLLATLGLLVEKQSIGDN